MKRFFRYPTFSFFSQSLRALKSLLRIHCYLKIRLYISRRSRQLVLAGKLEISSTWYEEDVLRSPLSIWAPRIIEGFATVKYFVHKRYGCAHRKFHPNSMWRNQWHWTHFRKYFGFCNSLPLAFCYVNLQSFIWFISYKLSVIRLTYFYLWVLKTVK